MAKEFTQLEQTHQAFYAPAYKLLVGGQDLLTQHNLEISSLEVDNTLAGADRFTFVVNSSFDFAKRQFTLLQKLFPFGAPVEVHMGYGKPTLLHRGLITSIKTGFPSSGLPQITVSGYDLSWCMGRGKASKNWDKRKDSDVAKLIAGKYGLKPKVEDSRVVHPKVEQNQQSDQQFLKKLAERNGYELYVFDRELFFRPPASDQGEVLTLEWGKGLVSFSPEIDISEQITAVEVRGWNVDTKKEVVGKAKSGDEPGRDSGQRSGAEVLKSVCSKSGELKVRRPVYSLAEATRRAKALLKKSAEGFVRGSGEAVGLPEIRADRNIELAGLGKPFSKTYYVEQATHTLGSSGYKTTFKVKDTTV